MDSTSRPILRWPLDVQTIEVERESFVLLRDPQGIAPEVIVFPAVVLAIISRFDGAQSAAEITAALDGATLDLVLQIASELEAKFFLEGDLSQSRFDAMKREFNESSVRAPSHVGRVYPLDPGELEGVIDRYLADTSFFESFKRSLADLCGVICPHIDYERGWKSYGATMHLLKRAPRPDLIFLIGTSHQGGARPYIMTRKDFATPLGTVRTDRGIVEHIAQTFGSARAFEEEILHRSEHSLELQLPFLYRIYGAGGMPPIVPILVGSFHQSLVEGREPIEGGEVDDFISALAVVTRSLLNSGKRVLFYGGIDLAHVGMSFGDPIRFSEADLTMVEGRDHELLRAVFSGSESALFAHMAEDLDKRRICGFPSMYTMLAAMNRASLRPRGKLVEYRQAADRTKDCTVTFASAYWEKT